MDIIVRESDELFRKSEMEEDFDGNTGNSAPRGLWKMTDAEFRALSNSRMVDVIFIEKTESGEPAILLQVVKE